MRMLRPKALVTILALLTAILISGCSLAGPDYSSPTRPPASQARPVLTAITETPSGAISNPAPETQASAAKLTSPPGLKLQAEPFLSPTENNELQFPGPLWQVRTVKARLGEALLLQLPAAGGIPPYNWSLWSGNLPPGLNLDARGLITGTPTTIGAFKFTLNLTDSKGTSAANQFSLEVVKQPSPQPTNQNPSGNPVTVGGGPPQVDGNQFGFLGPGYYNYPDQLPGQPYVLPDSPVYFAAVPFVHGGKAPWTFLITGLPAGLTFDSLTGLMQGTVHVPPGESISITAYLKDTDGNQAAVNVNQLILRGASIPQAPAQGSAPRPTSASGNGILSVSTMGGDIYVSGLGKIGNGSASISLPPGQYTVSIYSHSTGRLVSQGTVRVESGKTTSDVVSIYAY